jgi:hypothetical protein
LIVRNLNLVNWFPAVDKKVPKGLRRGTQHADQHSLNALGQLSVKKDLRELNGPKRNKYTMQTFKEYFKQQLSEKKDRCYYKAKRKYKVFPSAYASGYIVRCRKGQVK